MIESMWMVRGSNPVMWTIPYYVVEHEGIRERDMFSAIPLLAGQKKAADSVIAQVGRPFNGAWKITLEELESIAYPTDGGDPEQYFSWQRRNAPDYTTPKTAERRADLDEFIDSVYQTGIGNSRAEVGLWWEMFCNLGLDWMLNKNRALDLGFVKLHPSPYRRDWQRVLVYKIWNVIYVLRRFYVRPKARKIWREILFDRFKSPMMWAFNGRICRRYIDIEHKAGWVNSMVAVETARQKQMGSDYIPYVQASIQRRLKTSVRLFRLWAMDCLYPRGKSVKSRDRRSVKYVPVESPVGVLYEWVKPGAKHRLADGDLPFKARWRKPVPLHQKDGDLPGLSSLRQEAEDLRNSRQDVSGSKDEEV